MTARLKDATSCEPDTLAMWQSSVVGACAVMAPGFPGVEFTLSAQNGILLLLASECDVLRNAVILVQRSSTKRTRAHISLQGIKLHRRRHVRNSI